MTPHRTGGKKRGGMYRIDRVFGAPVNRVNISSGVGDVKSFRERDQLLTDLWREGQVDTLLALKEGRVRWAVLLQMKKNKKLDTAHLLADIKLRDRLWDSDSDERTRGVRRAGDGAVSRTIDAMECTESSRERYRLSWRQLHELAGVQLTGRATAADLRRVPWRQLVRDWNSSPANRNRARAAVSHFLTEFLGDKHHAIRHEILRAWGKPDREPESHREVPTGSFWTLMAKVPDPGVPAFVTLVASGMRIGELLWPGVKLRRGSHEIDTSGKTGGKVYAVDPELWAYVEAAIPCRVAQPPKIWRGSTYDGRYKKLRRWLAAAGKATGIDVRIHDLRRLFIQTGMDEGMQMVDVRDAVGQKTSRVTEGYARRERRAMVARAVGQRLRKKA